MAVGGGRSNRHSSRQQQHAQPPPLPFESSANAPIRIYPPDAFRAAAIAASPLMQVCFSFSKLYAMLIMQPSKLMKIMLLVYLIQTLQSVNKAVPVVGILSTSYDSFESAFAFANRVIGKYAFHGDEMAAACTNAKDSIPLLASVHLYFDDTKPCVYLLGIARPESQCFDGDATDVAAFERERFKLQLLLHSCCNLLFILQENARMSTSLLKDVRALASEKQQVLMQLSSSSSASSASSKSSKKSNASGGNSSSSNPFAPGRCVPLVLYVIPVPDEVLNVTTTAASKASSSKTRSATVAYCKAFEAKLATLFRSVRGGTVGSLRMRDVLTSTNLSKERRVLNVDPSHCAVVVSTRAGTEEGRLEARLADLMESIDVSDDDDDELDMDTLLRPLEDDDTGFPRAVQYLNRFVDLLLASSGSMAPAAPSSSGERGGGSKDAVRIELLTLAHWLKAWNALVKTMHRMETKRKQDAAAVATMGGASTASVSSGHQQHVYQYDQSDYLQ